MSNPKPGNSRNGRRGGEGAAISAVRDALRKIEYGSVLIVIHQGEVVGIETSTKVRLKDR
jgi:hypothetical protein